MMRKLKNRRGVSMVEMLVAIAVVALLTCAGITAATAAMSAFLHMNDVANADILASTVLETVAAEVRQGQNIAVTDLDTAVPAPVTGASLTLDSQLWGTGAVLKLDSATGSRLVAVVPDTDHPGDTKELPVLPEKTYAGLKLKDLTWTRVNKTDTFTEAGISAAGRDVYTVAFTVCNDNGDDLWHSTVTAAPMRW